MKKYCTLFFLGICFLAMSSFSGYSTEKEPWTPKTLTDPFTVDSTRYVADPDALLTPEDIAKIDSVAALIKWQGHLEYAVAVLNEIDDDIFNFSHELYGTWGLGKDSRGLLLVIVMEDHEWQFITGYGAEGVLPDALLKRIGENIMVPDFKNDEYGKGILAATKEVLHIVTDDQYYLDEVARMEEEEKTDAMIFIWVLVVLFLLIGITITIAERKQKNLYKAPFIVKRKGATAEKPLIDIPASRSLSNVNAGTPIIRFIIYYLPVLVIPFLCTDKPSKVFLLLAIYTTYVCIVRQTFMGWFLRKKSRDPFEKMLNLRRLNRSYVTILFLFICPWCWILYKIYYAVILSAMKKRVTLTCPKCKSQAAPESKEHLPQYLSESRLCEMKLHSMEYQIYNCPEGHIITVSTEGKNAAQYNECLECHTRAMKKISQKVIKKPTTTAKGEMETLFECQFCHHKKTDISEIAKIDTDGAVAGGIAGSGSRSGWGGGGGGIRGGGFSGGGGARGGW